MIIDIDSDLRFTYEFDTYSEELNCIMEREAEVRAAEIAYKKSYFIAEMMGTTPPTNEYGQTPSYPALTFVARTLPKILLAITVIVIIYVIASNGVDNVDDFKKQLDGKNASLEVSEIDNELWYVYVTPGNRYNYSIAFREIDETLDRKIINSGATKPSIHIYTRQELDSKKNLRQAYYIELKAGKYVISKNGGSNYDGIALGQLVDNEFYSYNNRQDKFNNETPFDIKKVPDDTSSTSYIPKSQTDLTDGQRINLLDNQLIKVYIDGAGISPLVINKSKSDK